MSFALAANGAASAVSQVNQFQTTFTGGSVASVPVVLGSASLTPLVLVMSSGGSVNDALAGFVSGNAGISWSISYASGAGGDGGGFLGFNDGGTSNWTKLRAVSGGGIGTSASLTVGQQVSVSNNFSTAGLTVSGTTNINASSWTIPSGSTYWINQLNAGAWWGTPDSNWAIGLGDDGGTGTGPGGSTYFHSIYTPGGSTQHDLSLYTWTGSANQFVIGCRGDGTINNLSGINFLTNGLARVGYSSGSGSGTFSHGLGIAPAWMQGSVVGTGGSGANCNNWFGSSSTFNMSVSGSWIAVAWTN